MILFNNATIVLITNFAFSKTIVLLSVAKFLSITLITKLTNPCKLYKKSKLRRYCAEYKRFLMIIKAVFIRTINVRQTVWSDNGF